MAESIALAQLTGLVLGQGIGSGSLAAILIAGASIAVGALAAVVLVRRLGTSAAATRASARPCDPRRGGNRYV